MGNYKLMSSLQKIQPPVVEILLFCLGMLVTILSDSKSKQVKS